MLALSTSCFPGLQTDFEESIKRFSDQGIRIFEFNTSVHPVSLKKVLRLKRDYGIQISSLHNICSNMRRNIHPDTSHGDNIASAHEKKRKQSIAHLKSTIEFGQEIGCSCIVLHGGLAENRDLWLQRQESLLQQIREGKKADRLVREMFDKRDQDLKKQVERVVESLVEVTGEYRNVRIGLENRAHFFQIPSLAEVDYIFQQLDSGNVYFWYDYGHACKTEMMGMANRFDWLKRFQHQLLGVHLHGVKNRYEDHQIPGRSNIDLTSAVKYFKQDIIKVLEIGPYYSFKEVCTGFKQFDQWISSL